MLLHMTSKSGLAHKERGHQQFVQEIHLSAIPFNGRFSGGKGKVPHPKTRRWLQIWKSRWLIGLLIFSFMLIQFASKANAVVAGREITFKAAVISLTNEGTANTFWVLEGYGPKRKLIDIKVATGQFTAMQNVSTKASAITQTANDDVALGTANGRASVVVIYGGAQDNFLATVPVSGSVIDLAASRTGRIIYALEATKPLRSLFVFDQTLKGFSYHVSDQTIAVAPADTATDVWLLQSDGTLEEWSLIPHELLKQINFRQGAYALAISSDPQVFYVLASKGSTTSRDIIVLNSKGSRAKITVPAQTSALALSSTGRDLLIAASNPKLGIVSLLPL